MYVRIKKLADDIELPEFASDDAAGFDLAAASDVEIAPGQIALVPTGLVIATPVGYFLMVAARSSTPKRHGLSMPHGIGIVDPDYCGDEDEIKLQVLNFRNTPVNVSKGDRIAQGVFVKCAYALNWTELSNEKVTFRSGSRQGFGSTGR